MKFLPSLTRESGIAMMKNKKKVSIYLREIAGQRQNVRLYEIYKNARLWK